MAVNRTLNRRTAAILVAAASTAAGFSQFARAGNFTWANAGVTWSIGANWVGGVAPANSPATDGAIFQGTPAAQPVMSASTSIGSLDFQSSGWAFSGSTLTLGTGGAASGLQGINSTNNATGTITINNSNLVLSASQIWTQSVNVDINGNTLFNGTSTSRSLTLNGTGDVNVIGPMDLNSGTGAVPRIITITGTGTMNISGVVKNTVNTATFRADTSGMVRLLNPNNTYTGGTGVSAGILQIVADGSLGAAPASPSAANISVTGSSTLQIASGQGNVTINGNRGVFINGSASSGRTFTFDTGDNTVNFSSPLTDQQTGTTTLVTGNFTKQGSGTMIFSSVNSLTGTLNFAGGTLIIANPAALGTGPLRWGGGTLTSTAPLSVNNPSVLTNSSHIGGGQTITFNGQLAYSGATDRSEQFDQDAGVVTQVNGGLVISGSATPSPRQFTIGGTGEVAFNSVISETAGQAGTLRIINTGTVTLNNANTYTGGTILDDVGIDLNVGDNGVFGSGPISWNAGTMRSTGAPRTIANAVTLGLGDTKLVSGPADFTFTGPITLAGGGQRGLSVGTGINATFSNTVSDIGGTGLSKAGAGTLVLVSSNTYAGGTNVRNGFVNVSDDSNLGAAATSISFGSSGTLLATSGTLHMSGPIIGARDVVVFEDGGAIDTNGAPFITSGTVTGPGALTKQGAGVLVAKHVRTGGLHVNAGIVGITANGTDTGTSQIGSFTIAGGPSAPTATFDLTDNDAIFTATPRAEIQSMINFARNGGAWNQPGLSSSSASAAIPKNKTLGAPTGAEYTPIAGGSFDGLVVGGTDVLVKFTYYGDTDFNGLVNFDDYSRTDAGFNNGRSGWLNGDFDGNNIVNFDDYSLIDLAFNTQSGSLRRALQFVEGGDRSTHGMDAPALQMVLQHFNEFGEPYAASFLNAVPEPTSAVLFGVPALAGMLVRRRRSAR